MSGTQPGTNAATDVNRPLTSSSMDKGWAEQHQVEKMIGKEVKNSRGDNLGIGQGFCD